MDQTTSNKGRILLWTTLLLFVCVVGYFFITRSSSETPPPPEAPVQSTRTYESRDLKLSFAIPDRYDLDAVVDTDSEMPRHTIVLLDPVLQPTGDTPTEGGPAITIDVFDATPGVPLEEWIRQNTVSNFHLASGDLYTLSQPIGGKTALGYRWSGLYESDTMAVEHQGRIYLFSVGWITSTDDIRADFGDLLETVRFRN